MPHRSQPKSEPKSHVLVWPPYMAGQGPELRDVVAGLQESERWSADQLLEGQRAQLHALLQWSVHEVPHYRSLKQFRVAMNAVERSPESFWKIWRTLPILTKASLRADGKNIRAHNVPKSHHPLGKIQTSGSTGIPVEVIGTARSQILFKGQSLREQLWQARDVRKKLGAIRYMDKAYRQENGKAFSAWGPSNANLQATGPGSGIHVGHPTGAQAAWLRNFDPHYLVTYPSVAAAIMDEMPDKPPSLEEVICFGEPLPAELEARLQREWNVKVWENYSANETGYIALQCVEGALHIQSEGVVVEIIGEQGRPCGEGQSGKVVVTPLHNLAMPLIRYEIGDIATVGSACRCGRSLPVISRVLGRVRNLAWAPDGKRFWPVDLGKLREVKTVRQFQYIQTAQDSIQVRVALDRPLSQDEASRVVELVRTALGHPFKVDIVPVPRVDRGPSGKFEEFLSLVPPK